MAATTSDAVAASDLRRAGLAPGRADSRPVRRPRPAGPRCGALILRDLVVLWKHKIEFTVRTLVQPFLLCFVFLYVFPKIGQGIGGASGVPGAESAFATVLVPGVVGLSIMFQGIQAVAMPLAQEFGFTREIEDRVQAPCPIWLVAISKVISGAGPGPASRPPSSCRSPRWCTRRASRRRSTSTGCSSSPSSRCRASAWRRSDCSSGPRSSRATSGLMFGFIVLPITFLGGTYYQWTRLAPVKAGPVHWLQIVVLVNPLIYINDGMRAAFTDAAHMHLYVIYPAIVAFSVIFLTLGLRNFRRKVLA